MMKEEKIKVGKHTYTRRRWVGRKPAPAGEKRVQYPARIPARLAAAADKKRGKRSRGWAAEEAFALWVTMDEVDIMAMLYTETS